MAPTPIFLPGESKGQRSLVGYSPWIRKESDKMGDYHLHFSFILSGECVISSVLSRHNKNLKQRTLKRSDRPCDSSQTDQCYSSMLQLSFI